jgi:cysteine desulfurase/selenocysteine lyase
MIYLDNASTSFPKPLELVSSIDFYLRNFGTTPGRGSHSLAKQAQNLVSETRALIGHLIGTQSVNNIVFTMNATHSLNLIIKGLLNQGDHVLICSYSHNSVIRPLEDLKQKKLITYDVFEVSSEGEINKEEFQKKIKKNTRLVIGNHASNVLGVLSSVLEIASFCKSQNIYFLLDATQSLGYAEIDVDAMPIDFLVGTGHKTLLGPSGVGFAYIKHPKLVNSLLQGGSGGNNSSSPFHPENMPDKFEAGTLNTTAIAGLKGSLEFLLKSDLKKLAQESIDLIQYTRNQLSQINQIIIYGSKDSKRKTPTLSFNISGILANEANYIYEKKGFCLRSGLQCAPLTHKTLGTFPAGTIRISVSHYNTKEEIDQFIQTTKELIQETIYA